MKNDIKIFIRFRKIFEEFSGKSMYDIKVFFIIFIVENATVALVKVYLIFEVLDYIE